MWLALGLPAQVLIKALSPAFFAREDTLTPLLAVLKGFAIAIVLSVVLGHIFGPSGIAAAIALGAWSSAFALVRRVARDLRIFNRCRRAPPVAAHYSGRADHGRTAVAGRDVRAAADR
jgi:peptidoglycan biosynthesis protein MviN/MurJ (putative lipid II flippase)